MSLPTLINLVDSSYPRTPGCRLGNVDLFDHQRAMAHKMLDIESQSVNITDTRVGKTSVGVLCDPVGSGKSNTVLCLIAHRPKITTQCMKPYKTGLVGSSAYIGVWQSEHLVSTGKCNVIVSPHGGVFKQWKQYIQNAGIDMQYYDSKKSLEDDNQPEATCILVSSTMFRPFVEKYGSSHVFNRLVIDEADSVNVPNMKEVRSCMYWLVTSSWRNLAFWSGVVPIVDSASRYRLCEGLRHNGFIKDVCKVLFTDFSLSSFAFVGCDPTFIEKSFNLPEVQWEEIVCRTPAHAVSGMIMAVVSREVATLIHAGDITGAISRLGCATATDMDSLTQALTKNTQQRLQERRARLRYVHQVFGPGDARYAEVQQQIHRLESQMDSIVQRCSNVNEDTCPVCFDTPGTDGPLCATRCCGKVFCLNCLQKSLAHTGPRCIMCRAPMNSMSDIVVMSASGAYDDFLSKDDRLVDLVVNRFPTGKFLVFSMYDRTFVKVCEALDREGVTHARLCGNSSQIGAKLKRFEEGNLRVLLLNANHFGQGYNLQCATNIVLYHRMTGELTNQMVGRAQRYGRKESLVVHQLVHAGESTCNSVC